MKKIIGEAKDRKEAEANAGEFFDKLDTSKDGVLQIDELLAIVEESEITDEARKEAEGLLETLDADKNGKVNKKEWMDAFGAIYDMMKKQEAGGEAPEAEDDGADKDSEAEDKDAEASEDKDADASGDTPEEQSAEDLLK